MSIPKKISVAKLSKIVRQIQAKLICIKATQDKQEREKIHAELKVLGSEIGINVPSIELLDVKKEEA
ncbi:hypothetical protein RFA49_001915 [Vibrio cholerae]|nr:hypothetical protein [Vibrio cholerae]ELI1915063.1 hypothetical protein [Vibrio cholerae]ELU8570787.1 hypothetical protein [Vibrio cholerae]GHZ39153.1 hypothetical protein VCSRO173_2485 [Vibrio cholerae]HDL9512278.1 hypothetical protein [Vibrio cholerae]